MKHILILTLLFATITTNAQKQSWLKHIATTTRLSAMHYSEMVCDSKGNIYIASYVKDTNSNKGDFIYIVKVSPQGEKIWERGLDDNGKSVDFKKNTNRYGRAISLTIDKKDRITIGGYTHDDVIEGDTTGIEVRGFSATLNKAGECKYIRSCGFEDMVFNVQHDNYLNNKLYTGIANRTIDSQLSEYSYIKISRNRGLTLTTTKLLKGNIIDVVNDNKGNFYMTGSFADSIQYTMPIGNKKITLYTENYRDNDGFLLKVNEDLDMYWLLQFGKQGEVSPHYVSRDAGCDLAVNDKNEVIVPVVEDSTYENTLLHLYKFSPDGEQLNRIKIASHTAAAGGVSIEYNNGKYYLSFQAKDHCEFNGKEEVFKDKFRVYIVTINENFEITDYQMGESEHPFMIRESTSTYDAVYFSGSYKNEMEINGQTLKGTDRYSLFLYKLPVY